MEDIRPNCMNSGSNVESGDLIEYSNGSVNGIRSIKKGQHSLSRKRYYLYLKYLESMSIF